MQTQHNSQVDFFTKIWYNADAEKETFNKEFIMNPSSIVAINRIIQVSTSVAGIPPQQRDFKNTVFIWKGAKKGTNRINYIGNDTQSVIDTYGSNSEVFKAQATFLAGGFNGSTPNQLYVANIDADTTYAIAAGELTYTLTGNYFTYSGSTAGVTALLADGNPVYADMVVNSEDVTAYLVKDTDDHIQAFLTKSDIIENKPIDFSAAPYSLTDSDATSTATLYADAFADALSEILGDSTTYLCVIDNTFSEDQKKLYMSMVEASTPTHYGFVLDTSDAAAYQDKLADQTSIAGSACALSYKKIAVVVDDADKANEYKSMSACSYFAQVNMTAASPMGSLMFKNMSGISASKFANGGVINATMAWDNITGKNANCFTKYSEVYDDCWAKGTSASGHQIGDIIAGDYIDYRITYELFYMLRSVPKLPCNAGGAARIENCMATAFRRLEDAGVIGPGVAQDGEVFDTVGYKVSATVPEGTDKAQGVWNTVTGVGLLTGSTTKIVVNNTLKY